MHFITLPPAPPQTPPNNKLLQPVPARGAAEVAVGQPQQETALGNGVGSAVAVGKVGGGGVACDEQLDEIDWGLVDVDSLERSATKQRDSQLALTKKQKVAAPAAPAGSCAATMVVGHDDGERRGTLVVSQRSP
eukprot:COSAG01_NODE_13123_length_1632_cov_2.015656_1_plen_134_part_00